MANTDKDILITPNRGSSNEPKIEFKGASSTVGPSTITAIIYPTNNGTLSFDGTEGSLFSIANNLTTGSIFSVNPISGIPIIDVNADRTIALNPYGGNTGIGLTNPSYKLDVSGSIRSSSQLISTVVTGTAPFVVSSTTKVTNLNADYLDDQSGSYYRQAWQDIDAGVRTNYTLGFQPLANNYAGLYFSKSTSGATASDAGFLLVRGTSDGDVYTAEGITLVADAGWLTLAQRTTASKGVRIMSGTTSSTERLKVTTDGAIEFVNGTGFTYNAHTIWHAGNDGSGSGLDADLIDGVPFNNSNNTNQVSAPDSLNSNGIGYVTNISLYGQTDGALYSQAYSSAWQHQIYGDYRTGQIAIRGKNSNTWQSWRTVWDSGNAGSPSDYKRSNDQNQVNINSPASSSGSWSGGSSDEYGNPKFDGVYNEYRYANAPAWVQYNIPAGMKSAWISQLCWTDGGYVDVHGIQSGGQLVFLRRINTRQTAENTDEGVNHDGSTITFAASGLDDYSAIRFTVQSGRFHFTGLSFSTADNEGTEGVGMVHPAQISHQGSGSGLDADTLDGQHGSYYLNTSGTGQSKSGPLSIGGATSRSTSGLTVGFTNNTTFSANSDIDDTRRTLSIVNESGTTNAMSALAFRINPTGGSLNAMLDMKFVQTGGTNTSSLYYTFNHNGSFTDRFLFKSDGTFGVGSVIKEVPYDTLNNGTLSWEGSAGQLFSITNNLTSGSIFSVNDVSGLPSIDVDANGTILFAPYGGNIGLGTLTPTQKLHVVGSSIISGTLGLGVDSAVAKLHTRVSTPTSIGSLPSGVTGILDSSSNNYLLFRNSADNGTYSGIAMQDNNVGGYVIFGNAGGGGDLLYVAGYGGGQLQYGTADSINPSARTTVASWNSTGLQINNGNLLVNTTDTSYTASDNTPLVGSNTNNKVFINGSVQLINNNDAIVIGRGTATFLKDEEIGFGWGGGWYMTDGTYLRVRNDKTIYSGGSIRLSYNNATGLANETFNVAKTNLGGLHFANGSGPGGGAGRQTAITFMGDVEGEAQAGIYVHNNNSSGTAMALATTNSYATGPQIGLSISSIGYAYFPRSYVEAAGSFRAPIFYDSNNITYYLDPDSTGNSINIAGSLRAATYNKPAILSVASGSASTGASFAIQQETTEGWTGIFVDYEPYTGWGLYHDNPNNYFCVTSESSTGNIRSFTVPSRVSGNRTAYEKIRFDQNNGNLIAGGEVQGTIFRDHNDTNYYLNPATDSLLRAVSIRDGGLKLERAYANNSIWFAGGTDDNHVLWNDYYGGPGARGGAGSGFDGMKWNTYKGIYFRTGSNGQYNSLEISGSGASTNDHQVYLYGANDEKLRTVTSDGIQIQRDLYISGSTGGNYANRLIVGNTDTSYTLQDSNLRPTIQAHGQYPVVSLNHTATSNPSHGPTLQFTCNGTGNQFVIGTNGTGTFLSMGYSTATDWNPHNGINGYNGTSFFHANSSGNIGLGAGGDWGSNGGGDPGYNLHFVGSNNATGSHAAFFDNRVSAVNGSGFLFRNQYGNHSWGIVAEYRVEGTGGADRPSILFSTGYNSNTWSVGYGYTDDSFRINYDHGHRNSSWGTTAVLVDRSSIMTVSGEIRAPIFRDSNDPSNYYVDPNGTSRILNAYIVGGVAGVSNSSMYHEAAIEVRERGFGGVQDDTWATAPRIGFHWSGRVASQIALASSGRISILNNPGNAFENFQCNDAYVNSVNLPNGFQISQGGSNYGVFNSWVYLNGNYGFYSGVNSAHFYPNDASYGAWRINGSKNGWNGIHFDTGSTLMMNSSTVGFHREGHGWQMRWDSGTGYISKGNPGGGTDAIILDTANYNSYAPTLTGTGASGTWAINITGTASGLPTYYIGGQQTNPQTYFGQGVGLRVAMTGFPSVWADTLWINGYAGGDVLQMCALHTLRNGQPRMYISAQASNATSYGTTYEFLTTYNYNSHAPTLTGTGASGTWGINITGNAATATNLSTTRANWGSNGTITAVVGQLSWKNYGNNHTIFDASASTSPDGGSVNNTNPEVAWSGTYPTLMGWNGANTFGVRVDSARNSDSTSSLALTNAVINSSAWAGGMTYHGYTYTGGNYRFGFSSTSGSVDVYADGNFYATDSSHLVWHAGNAPRASNSNLMYYQGFTLDANTMETNSTGFTYSVNAPSTGPVVRFSAGGGYDLWLNAPYNGGGTNLYFRTRNGDTASLNSWHTIWNSANDGAGSGLDADLLDGLDLHTGRNNEANKVVRTDGNGYIQAGWINTTSGDLGVATRLDRVYTSNDGYIRYLGLTDFKNQMGLSSKNNYSRRVDYTSDANYWVGSFGHDGYGANETFHGGSGFFDIWGGTNYPSGFSHIHGINMLHYTVNSLGSTGGNAYGWQLAAQYNSNAGPYWRRCNGGGFSSWMQLWHDTNDGAGSGLDADLLDGKDTGTSGNTIPLLDGNNTWSNTQTFSGTVNAYANPITVNRINFRTTSGGASSDPYCLRFVENAYNNCWLELQLNDDSNEEFRIYGNSCSGYGCGEISGNLYHRFRADGYAWHSGNLEVGGNVTATNFYGNGSNLTGITAGATLSTSSGSQRVVLTSLTSGTMTSTATSSALTFDSSTGTLNSTNLTLTSDITKKTNIQNITNAVELTKQINGIKFDWKETGESSAGVIAQEVEEILPEIVHTNDEGIKSVNYSGVVGLLVEAIKEQQKQIDELKKELKKLYK